MDCVGGRDFGAFAVRGDLVWRARAEETGGAPLVSSARWRFMRAMDVADADEHLALGISYEMAHSRPSRSIHPNVGGPTRENEAHDADSNIGRIGLLAAHLTVTAHKLAGLEPAGIAKQLTVPGGSGGGIPGSGGSTGLGF
jgi:hypothetical protein